jgi:excisionase family DNA binding protein
MATLSTVPEKTHGLYWGPPLPVPILQLKHACRIWLGGISIKAALELEEQGRLRLIRMAGKVFVAADDAQQVLDSLRPPSQPAPDVPTAAAGPEPITVTVLETARLTGFCRAKVWKLIKTGELESVKVGSRRLIKYASIRQLLK